MISTKGFHLQQLLGIQFPLNCTWVISWSLINWTFRPLYLIAQNTSGRNFGRHTLSLICVFPSNLTANHLHFFEMTVCFHVQRMLYKIFKWFEAIFVYTVGLNNIDFVFIKFKESLFVLSHSDNFSISSFKILVKESRSLCEYNIHCISIVSK